MKYVNEKFYTLCNKITETEKLFYKLYSELSDYIFVKYNDLD